MVLATVRLGCVRDADWFRRSSLRWKRTLLVLWVAALGLAFYLYGRHEQLCEPFVYSYFAVAEYCVVGLGLAFHASHMCELWDGHIAVSFGARAAAIKDV